MKEKLYPWLKQITFKQIRGFTAVVETGTVSAAARELHLTTPAVSLQLKDLEQTVGLPLLERNAKGLIPTEAGKALMKLTLEINNDMVDFAETISEMRGFDHGVVSVGVVSTARYFAPNVLSDFIKQHPEVNLQLQVGNRESTLSKLENMEIDIAITGFPPDHFEVVKEYIGRHPQIIIAPPDHPLAGEKDIKLSALEQETFLLREKGSGTRGVADQLFKRNKNLPKTGIEFGSNETIKQAVMAGMGIAVISAHTVGAELHEKRLVALNVRGLPINRKWFIVKHGNRRFLPSADAAWKFISRNGKHYLPAS